MLSISRPAFGPGPGSGHEPWECHCRNRPTAVQSAKTREDVAARSVRTLPRHHAE
jgi:hypothetical protein